MFSSSKTLTTRTGWGRACGPVCAPSAVSDRRRCNPCDGAAGIDAALVMLVDLPGVGPAVISGCAAAAGIGGTAREAIVRAAYAGGPVIR